MTRFYMTGLYDLTVAFNFSPSHYKISKEQLSLTVAELEEISRFAFRVLFSPVSQSDEPVHLPTSFTSNLSLSSLPSQCEQNQTPNQ